MIRCLNCGKANLPEQETCEQCGSKLLKGEDYSKKIKELQDYQNYRKSYGISMILKNILILLLLLLILNCMIVSILTENNISGFPRYYINILLSLIIILIFLPIVLHAIIFRWKLHVKYQWSKERRVILKKEIDELPKVIIIDPYDEINTIQGSGSIIKGPPIILIMLIFIVVGMISLNEYTDFKPLDYICSILNIGETQKVNGKYEHHFEEADMGNGVARADQTWAFVFYSDGNYTTYLNGSQQYSGKWTQTGTTLTVEFPIILGLNDKEYTATAEVARDASYFIWGEDGDKYVWVGY